MFEVEEIALQWGRKCFLNPPQRRSQCSWFISRPFNAAAFQGSSQTHLGSNRKWRVAGGRSAGDATFVVTADRLEAQRSAARCSSYLKRNDRHPTADKTAFEKTSFRFACGAADVVLFRPPKTLSAPAKNPWRVRRYFEAPFSFKCSVRRHGGLK